jgi:hypothetical protein
MGFAAFADANHPISGTRPFRRLEQSAFFNNRTMPEQLEGVFHSITVRHARNEWCVTCDYYHKTLSFLV